MALIERETNTKQFNRLLKALGMEATPVTKAPSGKVVDTNPIKDRAYKVPKGDAKPKKVTKPRTTPKKQKPSKSKSTLFGISFNKKGGTVGTRKNKKQSGHNRIY